MVDPDFIPPDIALAVRQQGGADLVVGLPSYNNESSIGAVTSCIREGLRMAFPAHKALVVSTDCGSTDRTAQLAVAAGDGVPLVQAILPIQDLDLPYHGIPGKATGLHLTLRIARLVGARACLMWSPDITSMAPDWIGMLGRPVVEQGFDFAVPLYARHPFDGAITNAIVRPLLCSLYGRPIRQPVGGEYAFSAALIDRYLGLKVWGTDLARFGSDAWTTTQALCGPYRLCQVRLGAKQQTPSAAAPDLGATLGQVLGVLFEDMMANTAVWQKVRGAEPIPIFGVAPDSVPAQASVNLSFDVHKLVDSFRLGMRNLHDLWSLVLPPATLLDIKRIANAPAESFALPDELWSRIVFDFALGYRMRLLNRSHLLGAFLPLYLGWLASFVREMHPATHAESEERLERLCQAYEAQKPYLISRWRSPDRFNP